MRETVIIFDGVKDLEIGAPYFFQHERIRDLNKEQVKELYTYTAIKASVVKAVDEDTGVNPNDPDQVYKLERGLAILEQMVKDMYGDEIGLVIINDIQTQLNLAL